jgi:glycosyltransferase involved in cell wall biosynthesis
MTALPKVSVVTVNYNMASAIAGTLDSILAQDYPNLEAVVIDGGSTDGSREIIAGYGPQLGYWTSERDRNLYDGMNKGVAAATGEWVLFMNAGDRFAAPDVVSRIYAVPHAGADVLYGHHIRRYIEQGIDRQMLSEPPDVLPLRMHCSHQAMAMRRQLLVDRPFALDLLVADYDAILAAHVGGKRFEPVDLVVAVTAQGGRTDTMRFRALRERMMLVRRNGLMTSAISLHYARLYLRTALALVLKKMLPKGLVRAILRSRPVKSMG